MHKLQLKPIFACFTFLWCKERQAGTEVCVRGV